MALVVLGLAGWRIYQSLLARHWRATMGIVISSRVWHNENPGRGHAADECAMQYRYSIAGKVYDSSAIASDADNTTEVEIAQDHPAGTSVQIFYNPANPGDSYLGTSISNSVILYFLVGLGLLAGSAVMYARSG